jgi:hypothetical protein
MDTEQPPYISKFIRLIMPDASERDQLDAQRDLDRYLDVIDRIAERIHREKSAARDKTANSDMSTVITTNQGETRNASP